MSKLLSIFVGCLIALSVNAGVKIEHWIAPSGARVYFVETRAVPIVDIQIDLMAGGIHVPADKVGLASLTASLLDTGAGDLDEESISGRLVDTGAQLSASADSDRASVMLRTLSSKPEREAAIELMRIIMGSPRFPQAALEREKARAIAGIRDDETRPNVIAGKRFAAALYGTHPYGYSASPESVAAITRDDLVRFHSTYYRAKTAVVSIIGDLSLAEAEILAQRLTEALPTSPSNLDAASRPLAIIKPQRQTIKIAHPAAQAHVHIGLPAIRRNDPDYFPLMVGNYSLGGGGFVSRLMKEVREKAGYAYSVYSHFSPRKLDGPFEIGLQTRRDQADAAVKLSEDVLEKFIAQGPTKAELSAAQKNMVDGLALRLDSNSKLLGSLAAIGFHELPLNYLDTYADKVRAVTAEQVRQAFARHVRKENLVTVTVAAD